ncbi:MAG: F-box protein, partial [Bdellovibrionia bacterium]
ISQNSSAQMEVIADFDQSRFLNLPTELQIEIIKRINFHDIVRISSVNRHLRHLSSRDSGIRKYLLSPYFHETNDYSSLIIPYSSLSEIVKDQRIDLLRLLAKENSNQFGQVNENGDTLVHFAACNGLFSSLQELITLLGSEYLSARNNKGETPLVVSLYGFESSTEHYDRVNNLIFSNLSQDQLNEKMDGLSMLHQAIIHNAPQLAKQIVPKLSLDQLNYVLIRGQTAFFYSIYSRFNEISEILLDILPSEDLNTSDDSGITPLMLECQFPALGPITMKLLSKLSLEQIRKVDNTGRSAFDYALQGGGLELIQAFEAKLGLEHATNNDRSIGTLTVHRSF